MSAWIKCSDHLPGSGVVLAYAPSNAGNPLGAISVQQAKSVVWWHGEYPMTYFTHWQPLPAAPDESRADDNSAASRGAAISSGE